MKAIRANKKRKSSPKKLKPLAVVQQPWDPIAIDTYKLQKNKQEPMSLWEKIKDYFWV